MQNDLLTLCDAPAFDGTTYGDLVSYTLDLQQALEECNVKHKRLVEAVRVLQKNE